jgi:hypothetical protein
LRVADVACTTTVAGEFSKSFVDMNPVSSEHLSLKVRKTADLGGKCAGSRRDKGKSAGCDVPLRWLRFSLKQIPLHVLLAGPDRCERSGPRNPRGSGARELTNRPRRRRPTPRPRRALLAPNRPPDPRRRRDRPPRIGTAAHPSPIPDSPATAVERSGPRNPSGSGARELTNRPRRRRPTPRPRRALLGEVHRVRLTIPCGK